MAPRTSDDRFLKISMNVVLVWCEGLQFVVKYEVSPPGLMLVI